MIIKHDGQGRIKFPETALENVPQPGVGFQGFICPKSRKEVSFDFCSRVCMEHCMPFPVLLALSKQMQRRERDDRVWHVTEILSPPQIVWLSRNNPWYIAPNNIVDMNVGTSWHKKLEDMKEYVEELGLEDDYTIERTHEEEIKVYINELGKVKEIILSGTPDLYVESTKTLWDYKLVKYWYTLKYMLDGKWKDNTYMWQLNIYRTLWHKHAEALKLFCYIKDYKYNFKELYDLDQTEIVQVPILSHKAVLDGLKWGLTEHVTAQFTGKPRPCSAEEMWGDKRLRCTHYCNVNRICPQYATFLGAKNIKEYLRANKHTSKPKVKKKAVRKIK
jgi:hypothetical protein